jgi:asparagine synthetase B (glutamine-hydrolysing)
MHELKSKIQHVLRREIYDVNDVGLLFSGGTDSLTCLFSLLDMGISPTLYTFHLEGNIHLDVIVSKKVAEYYGLRHVIITIPDDINRLQDDVKFIVKELPVDRKTNIQCVFPFLYVLPNITESTVVSGLCADDLFGTAKSVAIKASKDKEVFDTIRKKTLSSLNSSAYLPIKTLIEDMHDKKFVTPYRDRRVIDYFFRFSWSELNKPKQKQISLDAFAEEFSEQDIYRKNSNLQVGSGIREYHNKLINTPLNKLNRNRVDEIYKDLKKSYK